MSYDRLGLIKIQLFGKYLLAVFPSIIKNRQQISCIFNSIHIMIGKTAHIQAKIGYRWF